MDACGLQVAKFQEKMNKNGFTYTTLRKILPNHTESKTRSNNYPYFYCGVFVSGAVAMAWRGDGVAGCR